MFLLGQIPARQARQHLKETVEQSHAEIARLSELRDKVGLTDSAQADDDAFFALAALDYGLRLNAMQAEGTRRPRPDGGPPEISVAYR